MNIQFLELTESAHNALTTCGQMVAAASNSLHYPSEEEREQCVMAAAHAYADMLLLTRIIDEFVSAQHKA